MIDKKPLDDSSKTSYPIFLRNFWNSLFWSRAICLSAFAPRSGGRVFTVRQLPKNYALGARSIE